MDAPSSRSAIIASTIFTLTLCLSALLLFLVQPMVAKMVLPLLGGTPTVWNTCLVFFQALLLAGYLYAHLAAQALGRRHVLIHVGLLLVPLTVLPTNVIGWAPSAEANPALWLLGMLLVVVGLPYFFLSSTAPLLQGWYAELDQRGARDPYFLYAASNVGSMTALLGYPILVEPNLPLGEQARWWTIGYVVLVVMIAVCALLLWRLQPHFALPGWEGQEMPGWKERLRWTLLALVPASVMLGVTTHLTTDIAPVPLLWILPLAIYLLTFILAFARLPALLQRMARLLLPLVTLLLLLVPVLGVQLSLPEAIQLHLVTLFVVAMVCHGELARSRPAPRHLTVYYLCLSLGGVLGGACNALVAPLIFDRIVEYPLMVVAAFLVVPAQPRGHGEATGSTAFGRALLPVFGVLVAVLFVLLAYAPGPRPVLFRERNFIGTIVVRHDPRFNTNQLSYGTTIHGEQCLDPEQRREPLAYFYKSGPVGQFFDAFRARAGRRDIAVIGLGAGTLACYAERGDDWTYYDLDPAIVRVAFDTRYFTYLHDCQERGARVQVVLGDARLQLARETRRFDLIVLDAFTSDAIPIHLMTREALRLYFDHLTDDGVLIFNISSRYLRLAPVVAALAADAGLTGVVQSSDEVDPPWKVMSEWAVLARERSRLGSLADDSRWQPLSEQPRVQVWTDDYSNLWSAISSGR